MCKLTSSSPFNRDRARKPCGARRPGINRHSLSGGLAILEELDRAACFAAGEHFHDGCVPGARRERTRSTVSAPPKKSLALMRRTLKNETLYGYTHLRADRLGTKCTTSGAHFRVGRVHIGSAQGGGYARRRSRPCRTGHGDVAECRAPGGCCRHNTLRVTDHPRRPPAGASACTEAAHLAGFRDCTAARSRCA